MNARRTSTRRAASAAAALLTTGLTALAVVAGSAPAITPVADFTFAPLHPRAGEVVKFTSASTGTITDQTWDLAGTAASGATAQTTFNTPGAYAVTLTATDGITPSTRSKTVTVVANQPPVPSFTITPAVPTVAQAVSFKSTSTDPDGPINKTEWDLNNDGTFGDATTKTAKRAFATAGVYTVGLRVTDDLGLVRSTTKQFTVNAPPTASFTFTPPKPIAGDTLTFTSTSTDSDGTIASVGWDFDHDGVYADATGTTVKRPFATAGSYIVGVQVTDDQGAVSTKSLTVTVVPNQTPVAAFTFAPAGPVTGEAVTFTSGSKDPDGTIAASSWDLDGNGTFDDTKGPTAKRTFATAGTYTVSLQVTDDRGATNQVSTTVTVTDPPKATPGGFSQTGTAIAPQASKRSGPALLSPFPVVTLRGRLVRGGARIDALAITQLARGTRVRVNCHGHGCPFKSRTRTAGSGGGVRFPELARRLRAGIRLQVIVTRPGRVGKYTSFRIRAGRPPTRSDRCIVPGARSPRRCSAA